MLTAAHATFPPARCSSPWPRSVFILTLSFSVALLLSTLFEPLAAGYKKVVLPPSPESQSSMDSPSPADGFEFVVPSSDDANVSTSHSQRQSPATLLSSPRIHDLGAAFVDCVQGRSDVSLFPSVPSDDEEQFHLADVILDAQKTGVCIAWWQCVVPVAWFGTTCDAHSLTRVLLWTFVRRPTHQETWVC
jgi:hypothetical protein